ncbi:OsmC family protein [Desulfovibrio aminophilus]|nr:OsmC family protein [Desulfovibrio aminophilus]MCM0755488.1 OsmC family protein [Desulfovibrio aminophilus]
MKIQLEVNVSQGAGRVLRGRAREHDLLADQRAAAGGADSAATPAETLGFALGACFVSVARFVAEQEGLDVSNIRCRVTGTLDLTRAMGGEGRAGFPELVLAADCDAPWSGREKEAYFRRVLERCPVCENVLLATPLRLEPLS